MTLVLDAGALLAIERGDRDVVALLKRGLLAGRSPRTHGGVVGQVWRGGSRQARLAALLPGVDVVPLDDALGRRAGVLLARCRTADVVDAAVVLLADDGDLVVTSDVTDLRPLAQAAGTHLELVPV
ncbi:MAG: PIN domain nuclease [Actinobacteria bacterium]|nr:PIN domain nuclease [Actinomycetota bacterium]